MIFLRPDLWWVAVVTLLAIWASRKMARRRVLAITTLQLLGPHYRASRFRHLPEFLVALALVLVLVAFLQPVVPIAEQQVQQRALDIVLVVDLSLSMTQPVGHKYTPGVLLPPSKPGKMRIDAVKTALRTFINRRPDDRVGVVVFSDNAYVISPLTFDRDHLFSYFNLIDPETLFGEGMTAVGSGIDMAAFLLSRQSNRLAHNKVVVVFTDGASNMGRDPLAALGDVTSTGTRLHLVGVDLAEEQKRHPEVGQLIAAVRRSGGQYFAAESEAELESAARALDEIEKGTLTSTSFVRNEPVVRWLALPALTLLLVAAGLRVIPVFIGLH